MSALTEQRDGYTDLRAWGPTDKELAEVGWTREVYDRLHAEAELAQYERDQRQMRDGFHCRVKDAPPGITYRRELLHGYRVQEEVWK